jgi:hypothetical protein
MRTHQRDCIYFAPYSSSEFVLIFIEIYKCSLTTIELKIAVHQRLLTVIEFNLITCLLLISYHLTLL